MNNVTKNFGAFKPDDNRTRVLTAGGLVTAGVTSAQDSPFAYTTDILQFDIPSNAAEVFLRPSTDLRVSEDPLMGSYYVIPAGTIHPFGVADSDRLYIRADAVGGTLNHYFVTI